MRFCGCGLERGSAQDPPLGTLTGAQKVIQQRWYFSEPLVDAPSVSLSVFPVVRTPRRGELMRGRSQKKKVKGLKKSWLLQLSSFQLRSAACWEWGCLSTALLTQHSEQRLSQGESRPREPTIRDDNDRELKLGIGSVRRR